MLSDKFPDLKNKFDVSGVPTTMGFRNGKEMNRMVGGMRKEEIKEFVKMLKDSQ